MALLGKNKFGFVDGSIPELATGSATHSLWHRNDNVVASWLLNSLSKEMQVSVLHCSSAKAIWSDLKERFEQRNGPPIFQLKRDLVSLQQGSMSVSSYYAKLRSILGVIDELKPAHTCTCSGIKPWSDHDQMEYAMHFLMGLKETYSSIRGQILSMDPFPSITKVFSLIVQEEKQREIGASANVESSHAFAIKNGVDSKNKNVQKDRPICAHYGIQGHTKAQCYKLIGYPPNYKKNKPSSASVNQASSSSVNQVSSGEVGKDSTPSFQLTAQQYQQLMSLLQGKATNVTQNSNTPSGMIMFALEVNSISNGLAMSTISVNPLLSGSWIIDSGASTHVACSLTLFQSYRYVSDKTSVTK